MTIRTAPAAALATGDRDDGTEDFASGVADPEGTALGFCVSATCL